jgi:hypothetical protein
LNQAVCFSRLLAKQDGPRSIPLRPLPPDSAPRTDGNHRNNRNNSLIIIAACVHRLLG